MEEVWHLAWFARVENRVRGEKFSHFPSPFSIINPNFSDVESAKYSGVHFEASHFLGKEAFRSTTGTGTFKLTRMPTTSCSRLSSTYNSGKFWTTFLEIEQGK